MNAKNIHIFVYKLKEQIIINNFCLYTPYEAVDWFYSSSHLYIKYYVFHNGCKSYVDRFNFRSNTIYINLVIYIHTRFIFKSLAHNSRKNIIILRIEWHTHYTSTETVRRKYRFSHYTIVSVFVSMSIQSTLLVRYCGRYNTLQLIGLFQLTHVLSVPMCIGWIDTSLY